ncbi:MAG TPA: EAL domain-containing protein [Candidatus Omnitrophota bacterium]|nr:EAL domain-containing protein [Candidatus Omnitrophota bacterium]
MAQKHILMVDRDGAFVQSTTKQLQSRGYRIDVAHSGKEALEKVNQYPDLILLDQELPDITGMQVCQEIRGEKRLNHISIIIFTPQNVSSERIKGFSCGADDCVSKPIDSEELVARIEAVLRRNQVFQQVQKEQGALATELKKILSEEMITPYFQPIYSMKTGLPIGLEALSRPPTSGLIDNAEFLFKTALILDMYSEVERVCWKTAVARWKATINQEKLFLNCTPYFIESGRLNEGFIAGLEIDPGSIVLEITERTAIQKYNVFLKELDMLRNIGIKIAVDDVGSGFASLDTVVEIRPDIVKIDRQLVRELHKDDLKYNIMQAIISFCKKSKVLTVAEGIEEEKELEAVNELGVDAVQGYLLARPAPEVSRDIFTRKFEI